MWKRIENKELFQEEESKEGTLIDIVPLNKATSNTTKLRTAKQEISRILLSNIDVQYAVSQFYHSLQSTIEDHKMLVFNGQQHIMGILDEETCNEKLLVAQKVFNKIYAVYRDDKMVGIQVSAPTLDSIEVFEKLLKKGKINKWIRHAVSGEDIQDTEIVAYRFINEENVIMTDTIDKITNTMREDVFIDYLIHRKKDGVETKCIRIAGSLEKVMNSPYIIAFSALVDKLYLFTMVDIDRTTGEKVFTKYLTWS